MPARRYLRAAIAKWTPPAALATALAAALTGCRSAAAHALAADEEVYALIADRRASFETAEHTFGIEPEAERLRERLRAAGPAAAPVTLTLVDALSVGAENSREYQRRKEQLYLAALDLTLERWRFAVQKNGRLGALIEGAGDQAQDVTLSSGFGLSRLLGSGARIVGDIGLNLFRSISTRDGFDAVSTVTLGITQPLLSGFGQRIVREPLTQAERNLVYEVRSFERFRRTFAVDVMSRYLRLEQQLDAIANQKSNYDQLVLLRQYNEERAKAGRQTEVQVDQARQDELSSRDSLLQAEQNFQSQLDDYKFFLGLPPEAAVDLSPDELTRMEAEAPAALPYEDPELLAAHALDWRLDHLTVLDRVDDAQRRVEIAANALQSVLDFGLQANLDSAEGKPARLDFQDVRWDARLDFSLALERLPQRNAYRAAQIARVAAQRAAAESEDSIRIDIRDALREAQRTLQSLELQQNAVVLAERRVESTQLNLEAGRAQTRDILDAQRSLLSARNAATRARIDLRLAVLNLWRDLEVLRVGPQGLFPDPLPLELLLEPAQQDAQP